MAGGGSGDGWRAGGGRRCFGGERGDQESGVRRPCRRFLHSRRLHLKRISFFFIFFFVGGGRDFRYCGLIQVSL